MRMAWSSYWVESLYLPLFFCADSVVSLMHWYSGDTVTMFVSLWLPTGPLLITTPSPSLSCWLDFYTIKVLTVNRNCASLVGSIYKLMMWITNLLVWQTVPSIVVPAQEHSQVEMCNSCLTLYIDRLICIQLCKHCVGMYPKMRDKATVWCSQEQFVGGSQ